MGLMEIIYVVVGAIIGAASGYALHRYVSSKRIADANEKSCSRARTKSFTRSANWNTKSRSASAS